MVFSTAARASPPADLDSASLNATELLESIARTMRCVAQGSSAAEINALPERRPRKLAYQRNSN
jgi:hypothetical protein